MTAAYRRYLQAERETASPERLMVLLFQAALRAMRRGIAALEGGDARTANAELSRALEIVVELHASLDTSKAPELCARLGEVYRFVCLRLGEGNVRRDPALARDAERAFAPVAEAFAQAVAQLPAPEAVSR